jgi:Uma2 family endonuclease
MPISLFETPPSPPPLFPVRKRWTRAECATLEASGLFDQERVELIEGELISKSSKKRPHVYRMNLLRNWLTEVFGGPFVDTEAPIDVAPEDDPTNEPEPDLIVLDKPSTNFRGNPRSVELRLVVEIADTSLVFDLTTKARLYARAGIVEYWVLDIANRRMVVHRQPEDGRYQSIVAYTELESVAPLAAPQRELRVADVLGE